MLGRVLFVSSSDRVTVNFLNLGFETHKFTHTHTHTHKQYIHIDTHTYTHTYTHIHTYIHTYTHTHTHTHTHTYTCTYILGLFMLFFRASEIFFRASKFSLLKSAPQKLCSTLGQGVCYTKSPIHKPIGDLMLLTPVPLLYLIAQKSRP